MNSLKTGYKAYCYLFAAGIMLLSVMTFAGAYSGGLGTETNPYQISTTDDWQELTNSPADWNACFILTDDIDLGGVSLSPVGSNSTRFTGVFDGKGHFVQKATINTPNQDFVGVFGYVGSVGKVTNLGVVNVAIYGQGAVGGLVGRNHGLISACYASGTVSGGDWDVGGLVGSNIGGAIEKCYAAVSVTSASDYAGGLVGYNLGDMILNSYAVGAVQGINYVGGLLGANDKGYVAKCYSTGVPKGTSNIGGFSGVNWEGSIIGCFWDTQTSGKNTSGGGTGKMTAEMKTSALYATAGWDLVRVWSICPGGNYPRLRWQLLAADFVCPDGVGMEDMAYLSGYWLRQDCGDCGGADLSGDGAVTVSDLLLFAEQWLAGR